MEWNQECQEAFEKFKQYLETPLVLILAVLGKPLILHLTVKMPQERSHLLSQQAIYYLNKKFIDCEQRYLMLERICYTLVWAAKRLRQYMLAHTTWLITNESLQVHLPETSTNRTNCALANGFKAIKGSTLAEQLAHHPLSDYHSFLHKFLDKHIMMVEEIMVFGDSALVIYQLCGEWETCDAKLIFYHNYIMEMSEHFDNITFHYIPRDKNQMVDALKTLSSMLQQAKLAHYQQLDRDKAKVDDKPWYHDIKEYLENGAYFDKRALRRLAASFFLSETILYKRSTDLTLLCCFDDQEAKGIMEEVHEGTFGTHTNGHTLARKILKVGYYWTKIESNYCQRCMKCQVYANNIHVAPSTLHNLTPHGHFLCERAQSIQWAQVHLGGHWLLQKMVEATSYPSVTKSVMVKFIKKDIISHIITNNKKNLNNKMMTELCEQFKIKHHNFMPYRPKMNGAVEAAN
ncbi:hypothetical protein CR513_58202, partial [Mucuna pruriens]